ncbi:MAG: PcfJ domain-containing protein [Campylobacterota bacterium]|nr:PcfJ domain-containing protein [Campylobacterota bacterium]
MRLLLRMWIIVERWGLFNMTPWRYTTDFNKENHLFYKIIDTNYLIETFSCSCGHTDFIIKYQGQDIDYMCPVCENTTFYDANIAWKNIEYFMYLHKDLKLKYDYDTCINNDKMVARYITHIPNGIDFVAQKIIFSKKEIYTVSFSRSGDVKEYFSLKFNNDIFTELKKTLGEYLNENPNYFNIPTSKNKKLTLRTGSFFLKNPHLKSYEFYYWQNTNQFDSKNEIDTTEELSVIANNRKEKSVKKAVYQNFINQIEDEKKFHYSFIQIFTNKIKDPNMLVKFLQLKLYNIEIGEYDIDCIYNLLLDFLKTKYLDKQILKLFSELNYDTTNQTIFFDMVREFEYCKTFINEKFRKTKCELKCLHDEFVKIAKEKRYERIYAKKLYNQKNKTKACIDIKGYKVKLPQNGAEIIEWADTLHNCMAGYFDMIQKNETVIYGFFDNDILQFAVEICEGRLIQASGKYNSTLEPEEQEILDMWMRRFFRYENGVGIAA